MIGDAAMFDAIGEARVRRLAAEVEVGLARMADRPFADPLIEVEQARLVGDVGARLGGHDPARRGRGERSRLLVRMLGEEAARADRNG